MLTGTADPEALAAATATATIGGWVHDDGVLEQVTSLQLVAELRRADREGLVPPGLHPTDPPSLHIQWWQVGSSPWGGFTWCHTRLSCRSGARARALTTAAVVDSDAAGRALAERYGFPCRPGRVQLSASYDACTARVAVDGAVAMEVAALDPTPMALDAVQATSTLNLARTPFGLRLVQVEARRHTTRVERVRAVIDSFDPAAWGRDRLDPYVVVSAVVVRDDSITLPGVRFVCRPDVDAFQGTERVDRTDAA